ncbi:TetR/AcrR family transcriptional regulator [Microbacterium sp. PMB16]|uniref:TetR/AcrR family transcriptional regulator n=1 Tax=Microbacterium sp. PMB16 TaxID=3120157 RepID=UPI003F4BEE6E
MATAGSRAARPTFVEQARRRQLVESTIALVAEHGYAATSLARIADAAGITKGAVLYHFATKDAVIAAAYEQVLNDLVVDVGAAVDAADVVSMPAAYVRSMIAHFARHPQHARMVFEALTSGRNEGPSRDRWGPLADLLTDAHAASTRGTPIDARTLAIIAGGAIDAIVAEGVTDPAYDTAAAAEELVALLDGALSTSPGEVTA